MFFLTMINQCLNNLNYKTLESFDEPQNVLHSKIKYFLNKINVEICTSAPWDFLRRVEFANKENSIYKKKEYYYTDKYCVNVLNEEKCFLQFENDSSIIPPAFHESLLINGTCMRICSNPFDKKFAYSFKSYCEALVELKRLYLS